MNKVVLTIGAVTLGMFFLAQGASAANIKEGKWTFTTTFSMPGMDDAMDDMDDMDPAEKAMMEKMMGGMKMGAGKNGAGMSTTITQCVTQDKPVPQGKDGQKCDEKHRIKGNTVHFESTCPDGFSVGDITYNNDSMKGKIHSTTAKTKEEMDMTIEGKYLGPCDGAMAIPTAPKDLAMKQKELELKQKELDLQQKELELQKANASSKGSDKSAIDNVNETVNTTNKVKNALGGLQSLFGR